ncbi:MAG: type II toxin-antitoxin system VapC family toxin [Candidatus Binatia bacterium]
MRKKQVCIDASVALKLVVDEQDSEKAHALWRTWARGGVRAVAPPLFVFECVSALRRMVVRGDLDNDQAIAARDHLLTMPVRLSSPRSLFTCAWELATELRRPQVYDSFYLATAELLDMRLWTADERFYNAVAGRAAHRVLLLRTFSPESAADQPQ